jgi:hypothetical protein
MKIDTDMRRGDIVLTGRAGLYEIRLSPHDALRLAAALIDHARALQLPGKTYEPRVSR